MFSVVVAFTSVHDKYLPQMLKYLSDNQNYVSEVILVRDPIRGIPALILKARVKILARLFGLEKPVSTWFTSTRLYAGAARNLGWHKAESEWVMFLDADDDYSSNRFSVIENVISQTSGSNLFLHDFCSAEEPFLPELEMSPGSSVVNNERIQEETIKYVDSDENFNLFVPKPEGGFYNVHHGHLTVRTSLKFSHMFPELKKAEDTKFCRSVLFGRGGVVFIPLKLSRYHPQKSSWRTQITRLRVWYSFKHRIKTWVGE